MTATEKHNRYENIASMTMELSQCEYEELPHTAEVGLRVRAATWKAVFACTGLSMFAVIGTEPVGSGRRRTISVKAPDTEGLLVDWLNELLYWHETTYEVYSRIEIVAWEPGRLEAIVEGDVPTSPPLHHIKAVTYHGLRLAEEDGTCVAEVYFDV